MTLCSISYSPTVARDQNVPGSSLAQKPVCVVKELHMMPRFQVTGSGKGSWLSKISELTNRDGVPCRLETFPQVLLGVWETENFFPAISRNAYNCSRKHYSSSVVVFRSLYQNFPVGCPCSLNIQSSLWMIRNVRFWFCWPYWLENQIVLAFSTNHNKIGDQKAIMWWLLWNHSYPEFTYFFGKVFACTPETDVQQINQKLRLWDFKETLLIYIQTAGDLETWDGGFKDLARY